MDGNGKFDRMLIRSLTVGSAGAIAKYSIGSTSGDIHVVKRDPTKSAAEYMDMLWKLASS